MRYPGRLDVMLAEIAPGAAIAGVFTRSATRSAPVLWCEEKLAALAARRRRGRRLRDPGQLGQRQRLHRREPAAPRSRRRSPPPPRRSGLPDGHVFVASTGVIGEPLPAERIVAVLGDSRATALAPEAAERAARAIMTTDTFPKGAAARIELDGVPVTIDRLRQGLGHDRARHGDDAGLSLHRRRGGAGAAAGDGRPRQRRAPSTASPSTATPRPRTRC